MIIGTNISSTALTGVCIKIGVSRRFIPAITAVIVSTPATKEIRMRLREGREEDCFMRRRPQISPEISAKLPVATKCMTMPMTPLCALTVSPCTTETTAVIASPHHGPKHTEAKKMGTSAGSYSRNIAAGRSGKWMRYTSTTARAQSIAQAVSLRRGKLMFFMVSTAF